MTIIPKGENVELQALPRQKSKQNEKSLEIENWQQPETESSFAKNNRKQNSWSEAQKANQEQMWLQKQNGISESWNDSENIRENEHEAVKQSRNKADNIRFIKTHTNQTHGV